MRIKIIVNRRKIRLISPTYSLFSFSKKYLSDWLVTLLKGFVVDGSGSLGEGKTGGYGEF